MGRVWLDAYIGALLELGGTVLEGYLPTAMIVCVIAGLLSAGLGYLFRRYVGAALSASLKFLVKHRIAIAVSLACFFLVSSTGLAWGRHAGYVRSKTPEFRLIANGSLDLDKTRVISYLEGSLVSDRSVKVDSQGYFSVPDCYRWPHHYLAFQIIELPDGHGYELLYTEFDRNLRADNGAIFEVKFPEKRRRLQKFSDLNFETSRYQLDSQATNLLRSMLGDIQKERVEFLLVFGHADQRGRHSTNFGLGLERAREVWDTLRGLMRATTEPQAHVASFGEVWPIKAGDSAKALMENRRVEIYAVMTARGD